MQMGASRRGSSDKCPDSRLGTLARRSVPVPAEIDPVFAQP